MKMEKKVEKKHTTTCLNIPETSGSSQSHYRAWILITFSFVTFSKINQLELVAQLFSQCVIYIEISISAFNLLFYR